MQAMKGAPLLASECNQILNSQNVQVLFFDMFAIHPLLRLKFKRLL